MRTAGLALLAALLLGSPAVAGPYDPALRFLTHRTPHFQIHYHQGEAALATRLASIAEATHVRLSTAWALPDKRLTHVVLVDQTDLSNGSATVVPWNAIVIYPVPPSGADTIGNTDDWLEYVFTHEYAHILHLDRSRGWARVARGLFGRSAIAFPNLTLPLWQIEGLATLTESDSGAGRLHAGDFREVVDTAARPGRSSRSIVSTAASSTGHRARGGTRTAPGFTSTSFRRTGPRSCAICRSAQPGSCPS